MRQHNDIGTSYRSTIYTYTKQQLDEALASKDQYQKVPCTASPTCPCVLPPPPSPPPPLSLSLHLIILSRELTHMFALTLTCHECLCRCACVCLLCHAIFLMFIKCMHACTHTPTRARHQGCSHTPSVELSSWDPGTTIPSSGALLFPWQQSRRRLSLPFPFSYSHSHCLPSLSQRSLCAGSCSRDGNGKPLQLRWRLHALKITLILLPNVDVIRNYAEWAALWQMNLQQWRYKVLLSGTKFGTDFLACFTSCTTPFVAEALTNTGCDIFFKSKYKKKKC